MPCNCDYLEPNRAESESKRAAELIYFVLHSLGKETPTWIKKASKEVYGNQHKLNELVVMLCDLCTNLTNKQKDVIIYNGRNQTSRDLADWWDEHQKADRIRIKQEKALAKKKQLIKNAKSKLSPEEREALNIN